MLADKHDLPASRSASDTYTSLLGEGLLVSLSDSQCVSRYSDAERTEQVKRGSLLVIVSWLWLCSEKTVCVSRVSARQVTFVCLL